VPCATLAPIQFSTTAYAGAQYSWQWPAGYQLIGSGNTDTSAIKLVKTGNGLGVVRVTIRVGGEVRIIEKALEYDTTIALKISGQATEPYRVCSGGGTIEITNYPSTALTNKVWSTSATLVGVLGSDGKYQITPSSGYSGSLTSTGSVQITANTSCGFAPKTPQQIVVVWLTNHYTQTQNHHHHHQKNPTKNTNTKTNTQNKHTQKHHPPTQIQYQNH
jgi:hypothetical protein